MEKWCKWKQEHDNCLTALLHCLVELKDSSIANFLKILKNVDCRRLVIFLNDRQFVHQEKLMVRTLVYILYILVSMYTELCIILF